MAHDRKLLRFLEEDLPREDFRGTVFRYTPGGRPAHRENTTGARWNPPGVPAIYTTLERGTAKAELAHHLGALSPPPSRLDYTLYTVRVELGNVGDLRSLGASVGLTEEISALDDQRACRAIGEAAEWMGFGALLVPSARRAGGSNLVIYTRTQDRKFEFEVIGQEPFLPDHE